MCAWSPLPSPSMSSKFSFFGNSDKNTSSFILYSMLHASVCWFIKTLLLKIGKQITEAGVNRRPFAVDLCPPNRYLCDFAEQIQWKRWWVQPPPVTFGYAWPIPDLARTRLPNYMASFCSDPCTPSPVNKCFNENFKQFNFEHTLTKNSIRYLNSS